jgi:glycerophosphoryl diester phosphodiesterase
LTSLDPVGHSGRFAFSGAAEIIAHRGYSARAPENTLAAIDAAVAAGADAVEFDLHVSADGAPVLFHDDTLRRTTNGSGRVADKTLHELSDLDAGSWFGAGFAGEVVPTFTAALDRGMGRIARFYPEIKGYRNRTDLDTIIESVVERGLLEHTVFISMDWEALSHLRSIHPDVGLGYIVEKVARAPDGIARAAGDPNALLDFDARILLHHPDLAGQATSHGIPLAVWTVDDAAAASRLHDLGVPRITTNRVSELVAWKTTL